MTVTEEYFQRVLKTIDERRDRYAHNEEKNKFGAEFIENHDSGRFASDADEKIDNMFMYSSLREGQGQMRDKLISSFPCYNTGYSDDTIMVDAEDVDGFVKSL